MLIKTTKSLFRGAYQYKAVLVCSGAHWFRSGDMDSTIENLKKVDLSINDSRSSWGPLIKNKEELDYAIKLAKQIKKIISDIRVESPYISIYSNSKSDIDSLIKLDINRVKYISVPPTNKVLVENTILMPKINFDYRVTLGKTTYKHDAFISWADGNSKLKLTKSCKRDLNKDRSWGGTYFYITGNNMLLMAKMHLGGSINKVERIIKA